MLQQDVIFVQGINSFFGRNNIDEPFCALLCLANFSRIGPTDWNFDSPIQREGERENIITHSDNKQTPWETIIIPPPRYTIEQGIWQWTQTNAILRVISWAINVHIYITISMVYLHDVMDQYLLILCHYILGIYINIYWVCSPARTTHME